MAFVGGVASVRSGQRGVGSYCKLSRALTGGFVQPMGVRPVVRSAGSGASTVSMSVASVAKIGILVYAAFMATGGITAFMKMGSKPSLIFGILSAIGLIIAFTQKSLPAAMAIAGALTIIFAIRFIKTGKMMPAGVLGIASVGFLGLFAAAIFL